jgi:hypothetical protein
MKRRPIMSLLSLYGIRAESSAAAEVTPPQPASTLLRQAIRPRTEYHCGRDARLAQVGDER